MESQIIVYDKESGSIKQIIRCHNANPSIQALELDKHFDKKKDFLIESGSKLVDIKKDRIIDGKITKASEIQSKKTSSDNLFEEVQYKRLPEHVALIAPWNRQCGIANYTKDLVDNLQCKVTIFCGKEDDPEYNPKVKVIPCWTNRDTSYGYLVELLKKHKIDIAHVQYNHDLMNAGQLKFFGQDCKESGIRTIMTLHSTKGGVDIYGKYFDTIVVHTEPSAQDLIGENTKREQIEIIPIGTKINAVKNKEKKVACLEKNIDSNRPIIANFGFLLPQKGIKEQLRALRLIREKKYSDILLLVVCAIHKAQNEEVSLKYLAECKALVNDLDLNDNVMFITDYLPYDEIFDYLHCSDLIVMPYVNSAAQANSSAGRTVLISSRPFITTDVEIFTDFKNIAPQFPARDIDALANMTIEILESKEKQKTILDNMNKYINTTAWKNVGKKHMKVYRAFGDIKIDIEGQVLSYFSASVVNRNLACALNDLGVSISLKSVNLAENTDYKMGDKSKELLNRKQSSIIHVQHQYPPKFDLQGRTKVIYLQAETSVPDDWIKPIEDNIDFIWVYSNHVKELVRKSGITKPVEVIRCGYDPNLFNMSVAPIDLSIIPDSFTKKTVRIDESTFVFMFIGHAQERKNFKTIFKSYLNEFTNNDNVCFVVKSYDGGEVHKTISELVEFVTTIDNKRKELLPKYLYIYEDTDPEILPSYYKAANVLVQCSRAEGFGKPIVEAQALGIPSIAVAYSGPKDFCTEENAFLVPFTLVKSSYHVQSSKQDSMWANISDEDLRKVMRYCYEHPDEVKLKGQQALYDSRNWSTDETVFDVIDFVRKYDL